MIEKEIIKHIYTYPFIVNLEGEWDGERESSLNFIFCLLNQIAFHDLSFNAFSTHSILFFIYQGIGGKNEPNNWKYKKPKKV